ncbi:MAG: PQQ-like beta-propeller repeat protein, partial [Proteobacteria bacterium]|nr:PQQ-like beta-propeller repeat protein [Pseudomonadota bacterium]
MLILLLSIASAYPPSSIPFEDELKPPSARYDGEFLRPPVHHWSVALPGNTLNSATHAERSSVAVADEHLLVGSAGGDGLYMLSRRDGAFVRKLPARAAVQAEAAVVDDKVYFSDTGGHTWCYKLDGTEVWSHDSKAPILVRPTVTDGRVYVTNVDDLAVALDADSGELIWRYQAKRDVSREAELSLYDAPPAVVVGEDVLLGFSDGTLVSLEADTGDERWTRRVGEGRYPDLVGAPVPFGSDIYASGYFMPLVAIDKKTRNVRWRMDIGGASALVVNDQVDPVVAY